MSKKKYVPHRTLEQLIDQHESLRDFARSINEDASDVHRWKSGEVKIRPHAVVKICRVFDILPNSLRPDIFPEDLKFIFK